MGISTLNCSGANLKARYNKFENASCEVLAHLSILKGLASATKKSKSANAFQNFFSALLLFSSGFNRLSIAMGERNNYCLRTCMYKIAKINFKCAVSHTKRK